MRVFVLNYEFPPVGGGGGRAAYSLCKELVKRGHSVSVLTSFIRGLPREEIVDGIHVIRIPVLRRHTFVAPFKTMAAYILFGWWPGYRFIRKNNPDVIHAHFAVPTGVLAWALSVQTKKPYVLTVHLGDVPGGVPEKTGKWFRWVKPFTYPVWNKASQVVAVSEYTRRLATRHYRVPIQVIPNATELNGSIPLEIHVHSPPCLVFAGRFMKQKNPVAIVQILSKLQDMEWRCVMIGNGPLLKEITNEIEIRNMKNRFDLPGWISTEEVMEYFSKSDILLMPSLSEGLPVVGIQALSKGLAMVVSKIGGFTDLVEDNKNGFLIPPGDTSKFVECLRLLVSDRDKLMQFRKASLKKAEAFDIAHIASAYENIFLGVNNNQ